MSGSGSASARRYRQPRDRALDLVRGPRPPHHVRYDTLVRGLGGHGQNTLRAHQIWAREITMRVVVVASELRSDIPYSNFRPLLPVRV